MSETTENKESTLKSIGTPLAHLPLAGGTMSGNIAFSGAQTVDGVDISAHAADLTAHLNDVHRIIKVNAYITSIPIRTIGGTSNLSANEIIALPFIVTRNLTLDRLAIEVTTAAAAGKIARLGIYNDTNAYPSSLVLDAGTVLVDAIAHVTATINQSLTKGLYWLVVVSDGTPAVRSIAHGNNILGFPATNFASHLQGYYLAGAGAGALAANFGIGATAFGTTIAGVFGRVKSLD